MNSHSHANFADIFKIDFIPMATNLTSTGSEKLWAIKENFRWFDYSYKGINKLSVSSKYIYSMKNKICILALFVHIELIFWQTCKNSLTYRMDM